jgi:hypothetical protein
MFATAHYGTISWDKWIWSTILIFISLPNNFILFYFFCVQVFQMVSFLQAFGLKCYIISHLFHACYTPCSSHPPCFDDSNKTGEECRLWINSLCHFLHSLVTSSLFLNNLDLWSSIKAWETKFHANIKKQAKLQFCVCWSLDVYITDGRENILT